MNYKKAIILVTVLLLIGLYFGFDLGRYFNLDFFQAQREAITDFVEDRWLLSALVFFGLYVMVTALSLPVAAALTVIGGALFGLGWGLLLISFASSIGATLAFLVSRTLLQDWVQQKFPRAIASINRGVEKDGAFYLFSLRLVPLFPFFLINLAMGLTRMRVLTYYVVSQVGMLAGTALYVNVGAQLGQASSLPEVFSLNVLLSFVAIAIFPWFARALVNGWRARRVYRDWSAPKRFDANLVVIGAGSAGLVTSLIAALVKAKVVLIEKHKMGGDCLNTGCVPSKALIRSAGVRHLMQRAAEFGLENDDIHTDFPRVMARIRDIISRIEPHDSVERYTAMGVECISGEATITSPWTVRVNGRDISTRGIVLATGARPFVPHISGLGQVDYFTSDTIWNLTRLPEHLLVLGGGPIGCELAQAFSRLGAKVTIVQQAGRLLPREDSDVSAQVEKQFIAEGIRVLTSHALQGIERDGNRHIAVLRQGSEEQRLDFSDLLLAVGRKPNVEGFGLEALGIEVSGGRVEVNDYLQTRLPSIFACGDVAGPYQFTHMASFQAWYASVNALFGRFRKYPVNYSVVPWATFVDPEVARVGLNETEAKEQGLAFEVSRYGLDDLDRAIVDSEAWGFIKVLTAPGKDRILGVTIVGPHASELINEFVLAMTHGLGLKKIMATIHIYPTYAEANKFAASQWRRQHAPQWLYPWLERFHRWQRRE